MQRLEHARELLDGELDLRTLRANLRDLARVNHWLGGTQLSWRALQPLFGEPGAGVSGGEALRLIDVGSGLGDIPRELVRRANSRAPRLEVLATDVRPEIVILARDHVAAESHISVEVANPTVIAAPEASFDVAHCSLVLHHLDPDEAVALLREMALVARHGVIVNDLDRGRVWWVLAWLLTRVATLNRYTRNDAPLSVRRAYRPDEVREMAARAGLREVARHWAKPRYRYALVFERTH
jgi:ubiquinone/menaquinone biosynthesis C-methylase UbiE